MKDPTKFRSIDRRAPVALLVIAAALSGTASPARASEYGCKVLLCLANPEGPMAEQACQPPITQLMRDLNAKPPRPFPRCEEGAPGVATPTVRPYERCPDGSHALAERRLALRMSAAEFESYLPKDAAQIQLANVPQNTITLSDPVATATARGIGEGSIETYGTSAKKVCVSQFVGTVVFGATYGVDGNAGQAVQIYERVITLDPPVSPRVIDVYIGDKLFNTVRY